MQRTDFLRWFVLNDTGIVVNRLTLDIIVGYANGKGIKLISNN